MEEQPTLEGYEVKELDVEDIELRPPEEYIVTELPVEEIELQPLEGDENDEAIGAEVENPSKE